MESAAIPAPVQLVTATARSRNFSKVDQMDICHVWLEKNEDPRVGNDQSSAGFWTKIADVLKKLWAIQVSGDCARETNILDNRWGIRGPLQ